MGCAGEAGSPAELIPGSAGAVALKARVPTGTQGLKSRLTGLPVAMPSSPPRAGASHRQVEARLVLEEIAGLQQSQLLSMAAGGPLWQLDTPGAAGDGRSTPVKRRAAIRKIVRKAFINRPDEKLADLFPS
ncbi:MAG: hypothetical protein KC777_30185 [Cyanobacteria bacterium HKST-UBA02]|nr:hypothetical protein [Cyanobacteria bacterium HKST-UBA02]